MKTQFRILVCLIATMFTIASCDMFDNNPHKQDTNVTEMGLLPDSITKQINKQDSVTSALVDKVQSLTSELNNVNVKNAELESKVNDLQSPGRLAPILAIIAIILSLIAIGLVIIISKQCLDKDQLSQYLNKHFGSYNQSLASIREDINKLKSPSAFKGNSNSFSPSTYKPSLEQSIVALEQRIVALENKLRKEPAISSPSTNANTKEATGTKIVKPVIKIGYAKSNSSKYFTEILSSNQEGCIYKITFKNDNEGEFEIISLQKMKQSNGWKEIVETTGDCIIDEAREFTVTDPGRCVKVNQSTWEINKPLKIEIRK